MILILLNFILFLATVEAQFFGKWKVRASNWRTGRLYFGDDYRRRFLLDGTTFAPQIWEYGKFSARKLILTGNQQYEENIYFLIKKYISVIH